MFDTFGDRAIGKIPVSVATSLALESSFGIHDDMPAKVPPLLSYQEFWINVRTLFRNLVGSFHKDDQHRLTAKICYAYMQSEMDVILAAVSDFVGDKVKVKFCFSNYRDLEQKYPLAVVRKDSTEIQKEYTNLQNKTVELLLKGRTDIVGTDMLYKPESMVSALLLTHIPYDLISRKNFKSLTLIESHTGKIKPFTQWYEKYLDGKNLPMLPFREDLLQVFGDKETFRPMDIRLRREVLEVAKQHRWTATTTTDRIRFSIERMNNHYYREILLKILV